jgi:hypothetical protein
VPPALEPPEPALPLPFPGPPEAPPEPGVPPEGWDEGVSFDGPVVPASADPASEGGAGAGGASLAVVPVDSSPVESGAAATALVCPASSTGRRAGVFEADFAFPPARGFEVAATESGSSPVGVSPGR